VTTARIWADIEGERRRQYAKWHRAHYWGHGDCSSDDVAIEVKVAVLMEECGEVARAVLDVAPLDDLRAELVQVAAVAVAMIEWVDSDR
jgi:NTP pyrophosphatase (non-canonical NTP hydrolase)